MLGILHPSILSSIRQVEGGIRIQTNHLGSSRPRRAYAQLRCARVLVNTIGTEVPYRLLTSNRTASPPGAARSRSIVSRLRYLRLLDQDRGPASECTVLECVKILRHKHHVNDVFWVNADRFLHAFD
jgi:hypothetical protein